MISRDLKCKGESAFPMVQSLNDEKWRKLKEQAGNNQHLSIQPWPVK